MATAERIRLEGDQWVTIPATWEAYLGLVRSRGEKSNPRYLFHQGRLTIVSPGGPHEVFRTDLVTLLDIIFLELGISRRAMGSVTLWDGGPDEPARNRGVESDACYYFSNFATIKGRRTFVMGTDPPPDLAIEVVVSHEVDDALDLYSAFGVREVWVVRESGLTFLVLGPDRGYSETPTSECLPFVSSEELWSWLSRGDLEDVQTLRAFRDWVVTTLAPRRAAGGGAADGT